MSRVSPACVIIVNRLALLGASVIFLSLSGTVDNKWELRTIGRSKSVLGYPARYLAKSARSSVHKRYSLTHPPTSPMATNKSVHNSFGPLRRSLFTGSAHARQLTFPDCQHPRDVGHVEHALRPRDDCLGLAVQFAPSIARGSVHAIRLNHTFHRGPPT